MDETLRHVPSEVDFSFSVERSDGTRYTDTQGISTLQTTHESASTSKLVLTVIILRFIDHGDLNLSDRPQDLIENWPINSGDAPYNMTLFQLLISQHTQASEKIGTANSVFGTNARIAWVAAMQDQGGQAQVLMVLTHFGIEIWITSAWSQCRTKSAPSRTAQILRELSGPRSNNGYPTNNFEEGYEQAITQVNSQGTSKFILSDIRINRACSSYLSICRRHALVK